jgi:hypothetical protein
MEGDMDEKPPRSRINRITPEPGWGITFLGQHAEDLAYSMIQARRRQRPRVLTNTPTAETWADARDIPVARGLTLFMAVAAIEPRLTDEPETYVPDAMTVARALRRVREQA